MIISNYPASVKAKRRFYQKKRINACVCSPISPARSLQTAKNPLYFCYYSDDRDRSDSVNCPQKRAAFGARRRRAGKKPISPVSARAKGEKPSNARRIPCVKGNISGRFYSPSRVVPRKAGFSSFSSLNRGGGGLFFYSVFRRTEQKFCLTQNKECETCTKKYRAS